MGSKRVSVAAVLLLAACAPQAPVQVSAWTVRVGLLHSLTGSMEISEAALVDVEKMAIEEINTAGGVTVGGRKKKIEPIVQDGGSDPARFVEKATKLVTRDRVPVVFGGGTSASRRAVLPVIAENERLLVHPSPSEGLETSPNVVHTGSTANQQIVPALDYLRSRGERRIYLVGGDDVFSRTAGRQIRAYAAAHGMTLVGEGFGEPRAVVPRLRAARPDAVVNTLAGDANAGFFEAFRNAGLTAARLPVVSVAIAEDEVRAIGPENLAGHLVARNYYRTTKGAANERFVTAYRAKYGEDEVTSDAMEAAYVGVHLWAKAVSVADSTDLADVTEALAGLTFDAPEGRVTVDAATRYVSRTARIGVIAKNGRITEVWSSGAPIAPDPLLKTYRWWKA